MALVNFVNGFSMAMPYSVSGTFLVAMQLLLSVKTSFQLLDIRVPPYLYHINGWHGIALISVLYCLAANTGNMYLSEGPQLVFMAYGAAVLLYACGQKKRNAWILLVGYAVKVGMNAIPVLTNWGVITEWLDFVMFRTVKLFELPFAFACMFCINRRFADKFKESEVLGQELTVLNQALDKEVAARTQALMESQEQRRNMMLNIFHDLRSPLFAVKGCADIMPAESTQGKELLSTMRNRLQFLIHLTEQLFLASKLEDRQIQLTAAPYDICEVLRTLTESSRMEAEVKGIALRCDVMGKYVLNGDIFSIQQAFQNIISNALCFTPQGGQVSVSLRQGAEGVCIEVADTGKGIRAEEIGRIFTRYYRVEDDEKRASSGLGLSIAKEIIEQHNGSIQVESELGKGTCFLIQLPF